MERKQSRVLFVAGLAALSIGVAIGSLRTPAQTGPEATVTGKTAAQAYKNIQVLKEIPADQLMPTMQFIATSLGVRCGFCHVQGDFSKDDKGPKLAARKMIQMEFAIDKATFNGRPEVTCYTCHRGASHPVGVPVITEAAMNSESGEETNGGPFNAASMPAADQILDKYVQALGGADALEKVSSRVEKGTLAARGQQLPVEVFAKAPDMRLAVVDMPNGKSLTAYDGRSGWLSNSNRPPRELTGGELNVARLDADFHFATNVRQLYPHIREGRPEKVGNQETYVLCGFNPGQAPVKLYFDQQSGLLLRRETFVETSLGPNPVQTDYNDYRETDGVKIPFQWTIARPGGQFTIRISSVQQNVPIEDSRFAEPPATANAGAKPSLP